MDKVERLEQSLRDIAWLGLVEDEEIVLDEAALEISALDHPDVDLADYIDRVGEYAEAVLMHAGSAGSNVERARTLAAILAGRFGLTGDRQTYDDPRNADLISVIDRGRGLPVALSIFYVAIARRIGWPANVLNVPGHVLVAIGEVEAATMDPFNDGALVDEVQLQALLTTRLIRSPHVLRAMGNRDVLVRLLMNVATRAEETHDLPRALEFYKRITTIAPGGSHGWWERARLEVLQQQPDAARSSLSALLETTRDTALRAQVHAALAALSPHR